MALTNFNSNLSKEIADVGKIQTSREQIPNQFSDKIVLVADVNPKHSRPTNLNISSTQLTTGTIAVLTTRTDVDTYITNFTLSFSKNAACDYATGDIILNCLVGGAAFRLARLSTVTLQQERGDIAVLFDNPVKLDRGSAITISSTVSSAFAAGAMSRCVSLSGFVIDNQNA